MVVEPQDRRGDLFREVGGHQDDPHVLSEQLVVRVGPAEKAEQSVAGIVGAVDGLQVVRERVDGLVEGHGRHHRGVADGLELDVASILRALQLDDDQVGPAVDREQVDAALAVLPVAELLRDHQQVVGEDADLLAEHALEVLPLLDALLREGGGGQGSEGVVADLEEGHGGFVLTEWGAPSG